MKSYWTLNSAQMAAVNSDPAVMAAIARIHAIQDAYSVKGNFESEEDGQLLKADVELAVHDYEKLLRETVERMFGDFDAEPIWPEDAPALTSTEALAQLLAQLTGLVSDSTLAVKLAGDEREAINVQLIAADERVNQAVNARYDLFKLLASLNIKEASK